MESSSWLTSYEWVTLWGKVILPYCAGKWPNIPAVFGYAHPAPTGSLRITCRDPGRRMEDTMARTVHFQILCPQSLGWGGGLAFGPLNSLLPLLPVIWKDVETSGVCQRPLLGSVTCEQKLRGFVSSRLHSQPWLVSNGGFRVRKRRISQFPNVCLGVSFKGRLNF